MKIKYYLRTFLIYLQFRFPEILKEIKLIYNSVVSFFLIMLQKFLIIFNGNVIPLYLLYIEFLCYIIDNFIVYTYQLSPFFKRLDFLFFQYGVLLGHILHHLDYLLYWRGVMFYNYFMRDYVHAFVYIINLLLTLTFSEYKFYIKKIFNFIFYQVTAWQYYQLSVKFIGTAPWFGKNVNVIISTCVFKRNILLQGVFHYGLKFITPLITTELAQDFVQFFLWNRNECLVSFSWLFLKFLWQQRFQLLKFIVILLLTALTLNLCYHSICVLFAEKFERIIVKKFVDIFIDNYSLYEPEDGMVSIFYKSRKDIAQDPWDPWGVLNGLQSIDDMQKSGELFNKELLQEWTKHPWKQYYYANPVLEGSKAAVSKLEVTCMSNYWNTLYSELRLVDPSYFYTILLAPTKFTSQNALTHPAIKYQFDNMLIKNEEFMREFASRPSTTYLQIIKRGLWWVGSWNTDISDKPRVHVVKPWWRLGSYKNIASNLIGFPDLNIIGEQRRFAAYLSKFPKNQQRRAIAKWKKYQQNRWFYQNLRRYFGRGFRGFKELWTPKLTFQQQMAKKYSFGLKIEDLEEKTSWLTIAYSKLFEITMQCLQDVDAPYELSIDEKNLLRKYFNALKKGLELQNLLRPGSHFIDNDAKITWFRRWVTGCVELTENFNDPKLHELWFKIQTLLDMCILMVEKLHINIKLNQEDTSMWTRGLRYLYHNDRVVLRNISNFEEVVLTFIYENLMDNKKSDINLDESDFAEYLTSFFL